MNKTVERLSLINETEHEHIRKELEELIATTPETYWSELAEVLHWEKPWENLSVPAAGAQRWFVSGEVNYHETIFADTKPADEELLVVYDRDGQRHPYTRASLRETVEKVGAYLLDQGITPGSRVCFCIEDRYVSAIYSLACLAIGAKVGFIFFRLPNEVVEKQLQLIQPDAFFYEHALRDLADAPNVSVLPDSTRVFTLDEVPDWSKKRTLAPLLPKDPYSSDSFHSHSYNAEENSIYFFSSGTSSAPKAVPSGTAGAFVGGISSYYQMQHCSGAIFFTLDFSWVLTVLLFYAPLFIGRKVVIDCRHFKPGLPHTFSVFKKEAVNATVIAVAHFEKAIQAAEKYSLQMLTFAGTSLNQTILNNILDVFKTDKLTIQLAYGTTELGSVMFTSSCSKNHQHWTFDKLRPSFGVQHTALESTDHAPELGIKNNIPSLCPDVIATSPGVYEAWWTPDFEWFRTGDTFSDHGDHICLSGRIDDLIKVKGRWLDTKVYANTLLEATSRQVVPLNSTNTTAPGLILLVEGEAAPELEATIRETIAKRFGNYAQPKRLVYIAEFPRSAGGKLLVKKLKEQYEK